MSATHLRLSAPEVEASWRTQLRGSVRTLEALEEKLRLTDEEREGARRALSGGFPLGITPHYLSLADPEDPRCPVRMQCVHGARKGRRRPGTSRIR